MTRQLPPTLVFTRSDARALGWTDSALSRATASGRIRRVRHGHFTMAAGSDPRLTACAAALACRGSVISHRSAVLMHGLPLLEPPPHRPDLTVQPGHTGDVANALLHRAGFEPGEVVMVAGHPVTSVPRTLIDVARTVAVLASVVCIDAALHQGLTTAEELRAVLARCRTWPGVRRAAAAVRAADGRAESPLESVSRLVLRRLRLPIPQPQAVIRDEYGRQVGRCDFYWDEFGVFGEADGRSKYDDRSVLIDEKLRQEDLENLGLVPARWGWADVRYRQAGLATRVRAAFERGRRRDDSGFPRNWSVDDP